MGGVGGSRSGVAFKFSHVVHQRLHAPPGHGVVEAGTHTAHGLVALELQQTAFAAPARNASLRLSSRRKNGMFMRERQLAATCSRKTGSCRWRCTATRALAMLRCSMAAMPPNPFALALEPLEGQAAMVDAPGGRRVVHGAVVRDDLVSRTRWGRSAGRAQQVFAHHHQRQVCGAEFFGAAERDQATRDQSTPREATWRRSR